MHRRGAHARNGCWGMVEQKIHSRFQVLISSVGSEEQFFGAIRPRICLAPKYAVMPVAGRCARRSGV
jgi:hypothetical protein